jgi:DNA modification methylase
MKASITQMKKTHYKDNYSTIFEGDCREQLIGEKADCVFTSPPYNAGKKYEDHSDDLDDDAYWDLIADVACLTFSICRPGAYSIWNVPMWSGNREKRTFMPDLFRLRIGLQGWRFESEIVWVKAKALDAANASGATWGNYPTSPSIRNASEPLLVFKKPGGKPRPISDVSWEEWVKYTIGVWPIQCETNQKDHPAKFPLELAKRVLKLYSAPGETVCDPFMGSGTTLLAAKEMGRIGIGSEISNKYCRLASEKLGQSLLAL